VRDTDQVKLLVVGPLASGKTTIARHLRSTTTITIVDLDDELVRLNGGAYPGIETRKTVVAPRALAAAMALPEVVLLHSTFDPGDVRALRAAGFTTVLFEVSGNELQRRHRVRLREEGWSNEDWADDNRAQIAELRRMALFDHVVDAERAPAVVAADLLRLTAT
jgi:predicted kinase